MKINGIEVNSAGLFAFDGNHKFYIIEDDADIHAIDAILDNGKPRYRILPISELERTYRESDPLRSIQNVKLTRTYAEQCKDAEFSD